MKKIKNPFLALSKFERILWLTSLVVVTASFLLAPQRDWLSLCASLVGVTALIFVAKGYVLGQALIVAFAVLYGIVSFYFRYYGEMLTYLGMSAPCAIFAMISWIRHPYRESAEVAVRQIRKKHWIGVSALSLAVTVLFYFLLRAFNTANLGFSTLSVATSFFASSLTFLRSPYYALAYAANDIVLIVLWVLAAVKDPSYIPMIFCFVMFFANDLYGFFNWQRMKRRQDLTHA